MLAIIFGLWGGMKTLGGILMKNWKIVLIIIGIILVWYGIARYGESRYRAGVTDTTESIRKQVAVQNTVNRDIEHKVDTAITDFGKKTSVDDAKRHASEQPYIDDITKHSGVPVSNPDQCDITGNEVLDINAIRDLGPKGE